LEGAAGAAVRGIEIEDVAVGLDGAGDVAEVLLADLAEPVLELEVGGLVTLWLGANDRQLAAEDVGQLLVLAVALVDAIEGSQRDRLVAGGVEDRLVGGDRLAVVLDLVLVELADLRLDLDAQLAVGGEIELLGVDAEQVLVAALAQVQALEGV